MSASAFGFGDVLSGRNVVLDPSRVAAQVASGIGFLGAGAIVVQREIVRGLTTAASIWIVAAIGLAAGGGMYPAAIGATLLTVIVLAGLKPIETRWFRRQRPGSITLVVDRSPEVLSQIQRTMDSNSIEFRHLAVYPSGPKAGDRVELAGINTSSPRFSAAVDGFRRLDGVREVRWHV